MAKRSAEVSHNHLEGIKGAQATAACIYLARTGKKKSDIKEYVERTFGYNLSRTCDEIRPEYRYTESCQGSVPESIIAFLESHDYESTIRLAVSLGGDADTMGAIAGSIAEAYYGGIPNHICDEVVKRLPHEMINTMSEFYSKYIHKPS
jgi:ADP-ribosylglycohydrolase